MKKLHASLHSPLLPLCLCAASAFFSACVDVQIDGTPASALSQPAESPFEGLDPGYKNHETAHFAVQAYSSDSAANYASLCEENYTRIMQDLGLYSFVPARPYNVVIYRDAEEFHRKTKQPDWSGGAAYGNALLLYEGKTLKATIGHEMTHLVFNEFMGLSQAESLRWLNEGAAVYEESRSNQTSAAFYSEGLRLGIAPNPIPFSQMVNLVPQSESLRGVDRWYTQVGSVTGFMIKQGGSFSFSIFLSKLKDGAAMDKALAETYTGMWKTLADVEKSWKLEIQR